MSSTQNRAPAGAMNIPLPTPELLEAAALWLINRRSREAYLHEVRGGLHALYSALELLSRSAQLRGGDTAMAERAASIARRAMSNYEPVVLNIVESLTHQSDGGTLTEVDLGTLTQEVIRFLRADIANKRLELRMTVEQDVRVRACRETARSWILGLLLTSVDGSPADQPLAITLRREDAQALLVIASNLQDTGQAAPQRADALIRAMAARWAESQGGRVEFGPAGVAGDEIRVYYPLIASVGPEG